MRATIEPVEILEIDFDYCGLSYGVGTCGAALGSTGKKKCFNSWFTCQDKANFTKGVKTLRFVNPRSSFPRINGYFPVLDSVNAVTNSVNIAGNNPRLGTLGKSGKVTAKLKDFVYHDRYTDKYVSDRISGAAQVGGVGYDPEDRGTFFTKFLIRNPNYAGRAMRLIYANIEATEIAGIFYLLNEAGDYILKEDGGKIIISSNITPSSTGALLLEDGESLLFEDGDRILISEDFRASFSKLDGIRTRNLILTDIKIDNNHNVTIQGKDVLSTLAETTCPVASTGYLLDDINATQLSLTLGPEGIGDTGEYGDSGRIVIGNEVISFSSRSGDVLTLSSRAIRSQGASHSSGDTVQLVKSFSDKNVAEVLDELLREFTTIDSTYYNTVENAAEVSRWASSLKVNADIVKPTKVSELIGELAILGASIWVDDFNQKIKLRMNHPLDLTETATTITDDNAIKDISKEDRDEERITRLYYNYVQSDISKDPKDKFNYDRLLAIVDTDAENINGYGEERAREIVCRWLNIGNDTAVRLISKRILQRFKTAPQYYNLTVDALYNNLGLTDVIDVTSDIVTDDTGLETPKKLQIIQKSETMSGHEVKLVAQTYEFQDSYGFIMDNSFDGTVYADASDEAKDTGCFIIDEADILFADGRQPYRII
jgi:hypothetical protein